MVAGQCFEPDRPGGLDAACPDYETPSGFVMPGCCGPDGCGAVDRGGIGCIPLQALGLDTVACDYDPNNDCRDLTEVVCDGAEDCGTGQVCCGEYDGAVYRNYGCYDACPTDGTWREICHLDSECSNTSFQCLSSPVVPEGLARCGNSGDPPAGTLSTLADEINCGSQVCGAGQKCCLRDTKDPYCSPADVPCECLPGLDPDAGAVDGGGGDAAPDGGALDAAPELDAAMDTGTD